MLTWQEILHPAGPAGLLSDIRAVAVASLTVLLLFVQTCISLGGHCLMTARSSCKLTIPRLPQPASKNFPFNPPNRDHKRSSTRGTASVFNRGLGCLSSCCITSICCGNCPLRMLLSHKVPFCYHKRHLMNEGSQLGIRQSDASTKEPEPAAVDLHLLLNGLKTQLGGCRQPIAKLATRRLFHGYACLCIDCICHVTV